MYIIDTISKIIPNLENNFGRNIKYLKHFFDVVRSFKIIKLSLNNISVSTSLFIGYD